METLMQLWRPELELVGISSGSWYHCLPMLCHLRKSKVKRISGEAYDKNKQTIISAEIKNRIKGALHPGDCTGQMLIARRDCRLPRRVSTCLSCSSVSLHSRCFAFMSGASWFCSCSLSSVSASRRFTIAPLYFSNNSTRKHAHHYHHLN